MSKNKEHLGDNRDALYFRNIRSEKGLFGVKMQCIGGTQSLLRPFKIDYLNISIAQVSSAQLYCIIYSPRNSRRRTHRP